MNDFHGEADVSVLFNCVGFECTALLESLGSGSILMKVWRFSQMFCKELFNNSYQGKLQQLLYESLPPPLR